MIIDVASKYTETRRRLIDGINEGVVEIIDGLGFFNRCYFCQSRIALGSPMKWIIEDFDIRGAKGHSIYTAHSSCYRGLLCKC